MNVAVLGGFGNHMLSSGWTNQVAVAFLGGGEFDLTHVTPGENAHLAAIAVLGGINIIVDEGTQVTMTGFSLLGGREVNVAAGDGPAISLRAIALLGGVKVSTPIEPAAPQG